MKNCEEFQFVVVTGEFLAPNGHTWKQYILMDPYREYWKNLYDIKDIEQIKTIAQYFYEGTVYSFPEMTTKDLNTSWQYFLMYYLLPTKIPYNKIDNIYLLVKDTCKIKFIKWLYDIPSK